MLFGYNASRLVFPQVGQYDVTFVLTVRGVYEQKKRECSASSDQITYEIIEGILVRCLREQDREYSAQCGEYVERVAKEIVDNIDLRGTREDADKETFV